MLKRAFLNMLILIATPLLFLLFSTNVYAAKGVVVYKKSGCDYFIVETNMGYSLLEWYGGNDPDRRDILVGDYESYGFKDIYNLTMDSELRVYVEDYWMGKDHVLEEYYEHCN